MNLGFRAQQIRQTDAAASRSSRQQKSGEDKVRGRDLSVTSFIAAFGLLMCGAIALPGTALAEVAIHGAEYEAGVLVVRGQTDRANESVQLDGRYSTTTGNNRQFVFRVRYLPLDCTVNVRAGGNTRSITVPNCDPDTTAKNIPDRNKTNP